MGARDFDNLIGRTDRCLSELIVEAETAAGLDAADRQTLHHHADDLIGVGQKIQKLLKAKDAISAEPTSSNSQQCTHTDSGGVRCDLFHGHGGEHRTRVNGPLSDAKRCPLYTASGYRCRFRRGHARECEQ